MRSRAAVIEAARTLFLRNGYAGTTMEDIAALSGLAKRTLYNHYGDKDALFAQVVADVTAFADAFVAELRESFPGAITAGDLPSALDDLGRRLALGIVRPPVIAIRRLLIGESRYFPELAADYFNRAPERVMDALAAGFKHLGRIGLLDVTDARRAAAQFAYLVAGEPLDRAIMVGAVPPAKQLIACAQDGVRTFLARYAAKGRRRGKQR
ncbi:TetR/AcrR family transcriptional regulator C-terminal domain-containing protein [Luteimonas galliterrae]|uniref:TetR/AcrR family transcriptional regulator C-terminal domain-containing protein n=1 Tax=Luteimonas galliterrae TaxID=2940486 RepID=UPI002019F14E